MQVIKVGHWQEARQILRSSKQDLNEALRKATRQEAELLRTMMIDKLQAGPFQPLSPYTLAIYRFLGLRHGGKPLIMHGDLLGSIRVTGNQVAYYVGIPRSARNSEGESLVRIADIHERGRVIVLQTTHKMLAFLHAAFRAAGLPPKPAGNAKGTGILIINIPARPFMGPATEQWEQGHEKRFAQRIAKLLNGKYGTAP